MAIKLTLPRGFTRIQCNFGEVRVETSRGHEVKKTLQDMEVHEGWTSGYRTAENERFYNLAFDYLAKVYGPPGKEAVLDAGCGSSTKSIHLARRGYAVVAVDVSEKILERARQAVIESGFQSRVTHEWADLTAMSFKNGIFDRVLCWGVLMHVPDVEKAISELVRVTRPGGTIILSEGNMYSLQAVGLRWLKRLLGRERAQVRRTAAGIEFWEETSTGNLVTRQTDMRWLVRTLAAQGVRPVNRRAGQFTEMFTVIPWRSARLFVHLFNNIWFRWIRFPGPAFGNLLVFKKEG